MALSNHPEFENRRFSWQEVRNLLAFARKRLREERLDEVAGSLTFTSVLALVPMLTIAFALFTSFPLFNQMRASLETYFIQSLIPKGIANTILGYLTQFANKASGLSSVGAVALLVTAVAMMSMIERVFNQIWRVKTERPLLQRFLLYWAILSVGPILIGVSFSASTNLFTATSHAVGASRAVSNFLLGVLSLGLTGATFAFLYLAVPNRPVDWRDAAWGGFVAALAFEIAKRLFAEFISRFPSYAMIYGALAAIPIFLIWLYLSWMITLAGAVLTSSLAVLKHERWWRERVTGSEFVDAMALLLPLTRARMLASGAGVSLQDLRSQTGLGLQEIDDLLSRMQSVGWVGKIRSEGQRGSWRSKRSHLQQQWVLLAHPEQLRLSDICRYFILDGKELPTSVSGSLALQSAQQLAVQVQAAIGDGLPLSLGQWALAQPQPPAPAAPVLQ
ncbi:YihY family inner membrane protein [Massilia sp. W12]|uniref:YihY family inner membrane protein n=1 Tax=Massilia sp. W12 TaxID=3126507 RepID=UPI0030CCF87E